MFGDKLPELTNNTSTSSTWVNKTPNEILEDVNHLLATVQLEPLVVPNKFEITSDQLEELKQHPAVKSGFIEMGVVNHIGFEGIEVAVVPLPETKQRKPVEQLACCDDPANMSVVHLVGTCFCLKCRKECTKEHFYAVLERASHAR